MSDIDLSIRLATSRDLPFIFSSWLESYRKESGVRNTIYFREHHKLLERLLTRSVVFVATPSDDPELIAAYIVYEEGVLHWVYTRHSMRHLGLATKLVEKAGIVAPFFYSHKTPTSSAWLSRIGGEYNPYLTH